MRKLIKGHFKFRTEVFHSHQTLFLRLSKGQRPEAMLITCSDSRIDPNLITQTQPGDLFVLRNAGNIVPPYGAGGSEAATIEFAIAQLGIKHIIVCGHTHCGAMRGLLHPEAIEQTPAIKAWLQHAEVTRRLVRDVYADVEETERLTIMVEENVLAQMESLRTHPAVRAALARREVSLYAWVYKFETGEVFQYEHENSAFVGFVDETPASSVPNTVARRRVAV